MSTFQNRRVARQFYDAGVGLIRDGQYEAALSELIRAADLFRTMDVRGHPFTHSLPNGISGLANSLYSLGFCHQQLGNYDKAIVFYETALINSKFEKKKPFQSFRKILSENLATCYEKHLESVDSRMLSVILTQPPSVDPSFAFPYSLNTDLIAVARLYELAPNRFHRYKEFYDRACIRDSEIRYREKPDITAMRKVSVYTWGILFLIWAGYTVTVFKALLHK